MTNIDYIHQRTARRIGLMILVVWSVAFLVCIAPLLGWKDPEWWTRVSEERECLVSQDVGYQIFATASSFYLPLLVILFLYWRIFQTARKRIRRRVTASAGSSAAGAGAVRNPAAGGVIAGAAGKAVHVNCEGYLPVYVIGAVEDRLLFISVTTSSGLKPKTFRLVA